MLTSLAFYTLGKPRDDDARFTACLMVAILAIPMMLLALSEYVVGPVRPLLLVVAALAFVDGLVFLLIEGPQL